MRLELSLLAPVLVCTAVSTAACTESPLASVPYRNSFDSPTLGAEWKSRGGRWEIIEGRLFNDGARNVPLWLSASLPDDVRVSFTAESLSPAVDIKFEIFGDGDRHQSGYVVILSGWDNSKSIIARLDEHGPERTPQKTQALREYAHKDPAAARAEHERSRDIVSRAHSAKPNTRYRFRFERSGGELQFFVDDVLHLQYFDPAPLAGKGHDRFAFSNWASKVYFDDVSIEPL